jgi:hypothetical protein
LETLRKLAEGVFTHPQDLNPDDNLCPEKLTIGLPPASPAAQMKLKSLVQVALPQAEFVRSFNPRALEVTWRRVNLSNDQSMLHRIGKVYYEQVGEQERNLLWRFPPRHVASLVAARPQPFVPPVNGRDTNHSRVATEVNVASVV